MNIKVTKQDVTLTNRPDDFLCCCEWVPSYEAQPLFTVGENEPVRDYGYIFVATYQGGEDIECRLLL